MTLKTFWTLFLKILGIWLVLDITSIFPQFISVFASLFEYDTEINTGIAITALLVILTFVFYFFILRLFLFKTSWLIDKLKLDKDFADEKLDINIEYSTILSIATIVIGGLMFIDSFPQLCMQTFAFFQHKTLFREDPNFGWLIFHIAKTIISYLIMTRSKTIVKFIEQKSKTDNP